MSEYRDDATAARYRIAQLEERLLERDAEIAELRSARDKTVSSLPSAEVDPRAKASRARRRRMLTAGLLMVGGCVYALFGLGSRAAFPQSSGATADKNGLTNVTESGAPASSHHSPGTPDRFAVVAKTLPADTPRETWPLARSRPAYCQPRHGYMDMKALPRGTQVLRFDRCEGCDCCLPGGAFPPQTSLGAGIQVPECLKCSTEWKLLSAGIWLVGADANPGQELRAKSSVSPLTFAFEHPLAWFGLRIRPLSIGKGSTARTATVIVTGYDRLGALGDVVAAEYPAMSAEDHFGDLASLERFVVVEACEGETLAVVDVQPSEPDVAFDDLTFSP